MLRMVTLGVVFGFAIVVPAFAQNGPVSTTGHVARTTVHTTGHVVGTTVHTAGNVTTGVVGTAGSVANTSVRTAGSVANGVTGAVSRIIP